MRQTWASKTSMVLAVLSSGLIYSALAQYRNVQVVGNTTTVISPEETTILLDRTNSDKILAGSNLNYYYYSTNGGASWTFGHIYSTPNDNGDPCVVMGSDGAYYCVHLAAPPSQIACQRLTSLDGAWSPATFIGLNGNKFQDKPWATADPQNNRIYVAWTQFDVYGSPDPTNQSIIRFSVSGDSGQTWSEPVRLNRVPGDCTDSSGTVEGAVPAVGPEGQVYVSWAGPAGIVFNRSLDGGTTWLDSEIQIGPQPGGWDFDVPGVARCNGLPVTACDLSGGAHRGTIYVSWSDQRNGVTNTDIWLSRSTDGGVHWSPAKRVNDDNSNRHQFFSWMAVDQTDGTIYVVFYDRRNYVLRMTDVYLATSRDGGETFVNTRISESGFDLPVGGIFLGDYINIAAHGGVVRPIWTRWDGTTTSIWTALINPPPRIASAALSNGSLQLSLMNLSAYLTNYIDRSLDLRAATNWSTIGTFTGVSNSTNWTDALNFDRGAAFYRIRAY